MTDRDTIKASLIGKSSDELCGIYRARDTREWQNAVFEIIPEILIERGVPVPLHAVQQALAPEEEGVRYNVLFEGIFVSNEFGFIREGTISLGKTSIIFTGKIKWDIRKRVMVFLALTVVPYALFKMALGIIPAIIALHYFCASPGRVVIARKSISEFEQDGRQIQFIAEDTETGRLKKAVFTVDTVEHADHISEELSIESPNQASDATSDPVPGADSSAHQG